MAPLSIHNIMLENHQKLAIYMEENLDSNYGKLGFAVMRYSPNPIVCVIDSIHNGKKISEVCGLPFDYPVTGSIEEAVRMGAEVLVLGTAPSGGRIPREWDEPLSQSIEKGLCIINGLHDSLNDRYGSRLLGQQWIWDIRQPVTIPDIASARCASLDNKRVLLVGTDMAIGKMTAGLEIHKWICDNHAELKTEFLATGQVGITITGKGIPLDAYKVDHACGAVEAMVLEAGKSDIVLIEGQGSILHPGSTATLPLMRGSCATHLIMCHGAHMSRLRHPESVKIPPLKEFIHLNEELTSVCGSLIRASTIGIALNTSMVSEREAFSEIARLEDETGLPVTDVVRFGPEKLGRRLI